MRKNGWGRGAFASFLFGVVALGASDVAHGQEDAAAAKKQCLSQHEQSQVLKQGTKLKEAREALLACSREVCPSFVRADCVDWLTQLDRIIPSVVFTAKVNRKDEFNVKVTVDGQLAATRLDGKGLELNPGIHNFRFETAGWPANEQQVLIGEGEKNKIVNVQWGVTEEKSGEPAVPMYRPFPTIDYVLAGTALAGVGVFAAFGSMGKSQQKDLSNSCAPFCASGDVSKVKSKLLIADVGLGVAALSTVVGAVLFFTRPSVPIPATGAKTVGGNWAESIQVGVAPTPSGAFMTVQSEL